MSTGNLSCPNLTYPGKCGPKKRWFPSSFYVISLLYSRRVFLPVEKYIYHSVPTDVVN